MKSIIESGYINISYQEWFETRRYIIIIACQVWFSLCHLESSRGSGGFQIEWYISALIHDQVNLLGESIHTTKQNREALLVTSREIGLGVHAAKTKYLHVHVS
jgi:hypothetical protein